MPGPMASPGVAFVNLGCRVNRVEVDDIAARLEERGVHVVPVEDADAIVVNTCAVTGEAQAKTRKALRQAASMPQAPQVFATGCVVSLFEDEVSSLAPNITCVPNKAQVAGAVVSYLGLDGECVAAPATPGVTPTGRTRPGVKVQDGCDNRCSYCIVWKARGASRSVAPDDVLAQVRAQIGRGAKEVVLTGINLGRYEARCGDGMSVDVCGLLRMLLDQTDVGRIRLSSIEPQDVSDDLLALVGTSGGRIAPFLHMPLQSGCDATLVRMGRAYDTSFYLERVLRAHELVGEAVSIACDVIVGFPGETDQEFEASLDLCRECRFSRMHVFRYSRRPGTPAAEMPGQVEPGVMARRARAMRELAVRMRREAAEGLVGHDELVMAEYPGRGVSGGLFDVEVPGVPAGELVRAHVIRTRGDVLIATAS